MFVGICETTSALVFWLYAVSPVSQLVSLPVSQIRSSLLSKFQFGGVTRLDFAYAVSSPPAQPSPAQLIVGLPPPLVHQDRPDRQDRQDIPPSLSLLTKPDNIASTILPIISRQPRCTAPALPTFILHIPQHGDQFSLVTSLGTDTPIFSVCLLVGPEDGPQCLLVSHPSFVGGRVGVGRLVDCRHLNPTMHSGVFHSLAA